MKTTFENAKVVGKATNAEYMRQDFKRGDAKYVMSRSELKNFSTCPSRWLAGYREGGSAEQSWGDLVDCLALTPDDYEKRFATAPATYPAPESAKKDAPIIEKEWNWNAKFCKEWKEDMLSTNRTPVKADDYLAAKEAKRILSLSPGVYELIRQSNPQSLITADYVDRGTGLKIPVKGLVDLAPGLISAFGNCLADLKTCNSAHPDAWPKQVFQYGYDVQAAFYLDIWNAAMDEERTEFRHVLQENYPPYQVGTRILSDEFIKRGRRLYQSALRIYCECLANDEWPNYEHGRLNIDGWTITEPEAWMILSEPKQPDPDWVTA